MPGILFPERQGVGQLAHRARQRGAHLPQRPSLRPQTQSKKRPSSPEPPSSSRTGCSAFAVAVAAADAAVPAGPLGRKKDPLAVWRSWMSCYSLRLMMNLWLAWSTALERMTREHRTRSIWLFAVSRPLLSVPSIFATAGARGKPRAEIEHTRR